MLTIYICSVLIIQNPWNSDRKQIFVDGYDMVSYYQDSGPLMGKMEFQVEHEGHIFYFVSLQNKELFIQNPDNYVPAYGGWCAYAMGASGGKVKVDPETFKIVDEKINLFYNFRGNNTLVDWNENEFFLKQKAEANWRILLDREE